jgi:hypothetical protein
MDIGVELLILYNPSNRVQVSEEELVIALASAGA